MNVIDSSCWIEYLLDSSIGAAVSHIIEKPSCLIIPVITLYEVYKKLLREKDDVYAANVIEYMKRGKVINLDSELSVFSANTSQKYKLPMADSIVYATSIRHNAILWTCDKHFEDIPGIRYFSKKQNKV
jgi:predicted nucleic acid-binding protein